MRHDLDCIFADVLNDVLEQVNARTNGFSLGVFELLQNENYYAKMGLGLLDQTERGCSAYVAPFVRMAAVSLGQTIGAVRAKGFPVLSSCMLPILKHINDRLTQYANSTYALLLNASKVRGDITGDAHAVGLAFDNGLMDPEFRKSCHDRFPVLDYILFTVSEDITNFAVEFFSRLEADWPDLNQLSCGGIGDILSVTFGAGDPHDRGRSTVILHGSLNDVVYKPRCLKSDQSFAFFVQWINASLGTSLKHPQTLLRTDYGWVEFVPHNSVSSQDEVILAYENIGRLLAVVYILGGNDIHFENIIFDGTFPHIIDVETLLTGQYTLIDDDMNDFVLAFKRTPLSVGYFPAITSVRNNPLDLSGAGYRGGEAMQVQEVLAKDDGSYGVDSVQILTREYFNNPTLNGVAQDVMVYYKNIMNGYAESMRCIFDKRKEIFDNNQLIDGLKELDLRFVPRATNRYQQVLLLALHPHNCTDWQTFLEALKPLAYDLDKLQSGSYTSLLKCDMMSMSRGDIPLYKSNSGSKHLRASGNESIEEFFTQTGFAAFEERLQSMTLKIIENDVRFIEMSFESKNFNKRGYKAVDFGKPCNNFIKETAVQMAEKICDNAIYTGNSVNFVGVKPTYELFYAGLVSQNLYDGKSGIGLFFSNIWKLTQNERYRDVAIKCRDIGYRDLKLDERNFGAFNGFAGKIYYDLILNRTFGIDFDHDINERILHYEDLIARDCVYDVISGTAGILVVMLRCLEFPELQANASHIAHICARHLLDNVEKFDDSVAWKSTTNDRPLTGLAHGACGVSWALAEYAKVFSCSRSWETAYQGLNYARSSFDDSSGLWRDLRFNDDGTSMVAWCHGAAGMALARQRILELDPDRGNQSIYADVGFGLDAIFKYNSKMNNDAICHGRTGNWESLWRGDASHRQVAELEVLKLCARWREGILPRGGIDQMPPDLMNGLAGVGLQLLRSVDFAGTSNALLLMV